MTRPAAQGEPTGKAAKDFGALRNGNGVGRVEELAGGGLRGAGHVTAVQTVAKHDVERLDAVLDQLGRLAARAMMARLSPRQASRTRPKSMSRAWLSLILKRRSPRPPGAGAARGESNGSRSACDGGQIGLGRHGHLPFEGVRGARTQV